MATPLLSDRAHAFVVFARESSFTRASERLHLSQAAVHNKITKFQAEIGQTLYRRQGAGVTITPHGQRLAALIERLAGECEQFARPDAPRLVVVAPPGVYAYLLEKAIRSSLNENVELELTFGHGTAAIQAVRDGRADLAVSLFERLPTDLDVIHFATYGQKVVLPPAHPLLKGRATPPACLRIADLVEFPMIVAPTGHVIRDRLDDAFAASGHQLENVVIETEGWDLGLRLLGMGVGMGAGIAIAHEYVPVGPDLVAVKLADVPDVAYHAITYLGGCNDPRVTAFLDKARPAEQASHAAGNGG